MNAVPEWDALPAALRRRIETAMLLCFGIGLVGGCVAAVVVAVVAR